VALPDLEVGVAGLTLRRNLNRIPILRCQFHRPPNVPPLSSGRIRKRGGSR
jgi:hypothetical protein